MSARGFEIALNSISQGVCFFDGAGRLLLANARYAEIYSIDPALIRPGMSLSDVVELRLRSGASPMMTAEQYVSWHLQVNTEKEPNRSAVELANGRVVEIHNQPMPDGGWVATHEDITARTGVEAQVSHMARHDALTGLANRLLFHERLQAALAGPPQQYAVLYLDLDGFKPVNDSFGHPAGDLLLQAVAGRLRHCTRQDDTVSRLGGDEFAILAPIDQPDYAAELARRIRNALSSPFQLGDLTLCVSVSIGIGIAWSQGDAAASEALLKQADVALYRAKLEEPGGYRFFEPAMEEQQLGRVRLENELRQAIDRKEFELFYQPLLDLQRGEVRAFEALLRWRHPERGLLSASDFISIAESSGMIVPLGAWVLSQACIDVSRWPEHITVAVNLSPAQFRSKSLVATVQHALTVSGIAAARLELEVTESLLLEDEAGALATLRAITALGVRVSLDDFGAGNSSLNHLRRFPFSKIKIDRTYVREMADQSGSMAVVRAILGLGRGLDMIVAAEGVETEAQLSRLRDEGCNEVQGFLFSQPRPAAEVPHMLRSQGRAESVSEAA